MKGLVRYSTIILAVLLTCISEKASHETRNEWSRASFARNESIYNLSINPASNEIDTSKNETMYNALQDCWTLIRSQPPIQPMKHYRYFTGSAGQKFIDDWSISSGYPVYHVVSLHAIGAVEEESEWTKICVGMFDVTSFTYSDKPAAGGRPIAWVTTHTRSEHAIGFLKIQTRCYRTTKQFEDCSAQLYPSVFVGKLPQFYWIPIVEQFWENFTIADIQIFVPWIWKININLNKTTHDINIETNWLYKLDIPFLNELEVTGNDWGRPQQLLGRLENLRYLDLRYNKLEILPDGMLNNLPELKYLIVSHNNISEFPLSIRNLEYFEALVISDSISETPLTILDEDFKNLSQSLNQLQFDNTLLNANLSSFFLLPSLKKLNLSGCFVRHDQFVNDSFLSNLELLDLTSNNIESLPFSNLPRLSELILRNNSFKLWHYSFLNENNLTALYLPNNHISNLTDDSFKNLNILETLSLSGNCIEVISTGVFSHNLLLRQIDLSDNNIEFLPNYVFWNLVQLEEVYLSNNKLKEVPYFWNSGLICLDLSFNVLTDYKQNNSFIVLVNLSNNNVSTLEIEAVQTLNISYNNLRVIPTDMWSSILRSQEVDFGGNNFECCLFGNNSYVTENQQMLLNLGTHASLTCNINETSPKILLESFEYNEAECRSEHFLATIGVEVIVPLIIIAIAIVLVATLIYVYRFDLTYVKHLIKLKKLGTKNDENRYNTCDYDAFVCYSAKNFPWVHDRLLPALERPPHAYRLCVHDRDFALGAAINENIVASLSKSRKVILVLSKDFIASKWCQWELEMASHKMFVEKRSSIVLLELEHLEQKRLPWHLQYLMARITYLQWPSDGDPWEEAEAETEAEAGAGEEDACRGHREEAAGDARRQRRLRREAACLKRLREALGESLSQRNGARASPPPRTVLDPS